MEYKSMNNLCMGDLSAGPFRLTYRVEGTGRPVIIIGSSTYDARTFSGNLRNYFRLAFMDHRGFAPSPGTVSTKEFGLETLIDDIEHLRQKLNLERVAVIGHSGHSYMALEYAKKYPQYVSHVVMIGIAPDLGPVRVEMAKQYWLDTATAERKAVEEENIRLMPDDELKRFAPGDAFKRGYIRNAARVWHDPRFDCSPLWEGVEINMTIFQHVWKHIFVSIDVTRGLNIFDRPVFLALGRHDYLVAPLASWDPIVPKFHDLTVRVFEKSGHTPQFEEPEAFDAELIRWMNGHNG